MAVSLKESTISHLRRLSECGVPEPDLLEVVFNRWESEYLIWVTNGAGKCLAWSGSNPDDAAEIVAAHREAYPSMVVADAS